MCDTLAMVAEDRVLFAKNSDRDANEAQILEWHPRAEHPPDTALRCTWIEIPQARRTWATLISRPFWMWGAEMGSNEHGLTLGNEAVFGRHRPPSIGLTGMDLLRLALERARRVDEAIEVICDLLATYGQGGGCGYENRRFRYSSSFLIADPRRAVVLETDGSEWAMEEVRGPRSISNGLTIPGFAQRGRWLETTIARADERRQRTTAAAASTTGVLDLMGALRDHGGAPAESTAFAPPSYRALAGTLHAPCNHGGGWLASSVTTASWVAELRPGACRHWVTATAAPCLSLFKPARVEIPLDGDRFIGRPRDRADNSLWWRNEALHRSVLRDPGHLAPLFLSERDAAERKWVSNPPETARETEMIWRDADRWLERWKARIAREPVLDQRPFRARRYWRKRDRQAGIVPSIGPSTDDGDQLPGTAIGKTESKHDNTRQTLFEPRDHRED